jgi:hypothetical protein
VHRDLIRALIPASAETLKPTLPQVKDWMRESLAPLLLSGPVAALIKGLARQGAVAEAMDLFIYWLAPAEDSDEVSNPLDIEGWEFEHALEDSVSLLAEIDALATLRALIEILSRILSKEFGGLDGAPPYDGSSSWRAAIEDDEQNGYITNKGRLLVQIRDTARMSVGDDCPQLAVVVETLLTHPWFSLTRVAMEIVRSNKVRCPDQVARFLLNKDLFNESGVFHEYMTLLRDRFGELDLDQQRQVIEWISAGPETTAYVSANAALDREPPSEEDLARHVDYWKARRLTVLEHWLRAEALEEARKIIARTGPIEHAEYLSWSSGIFVGPTSPFSDDQIHAMSEEELVRQLTDWEPPAGFMLPTVEGLGRTLASAITAEPDRYLERAEIFTDLDPTYVRAVFEAVRELLSQSVDYRPSESVWEAVLKLADWVVRQGPGPESSESFERDEGWTNCRKTLAHVLDTAINRRLIPVSHSEELWAILTELLGDTQPSPAFEATYGGDNMDPASLAINTVRGTAMHAAIAYLLWGAGGGEGPFPVSSTYLDVVASHLDPLLEQSSAVRSVFGWYFPSLAQYYPEWAASHVSDFFPLDDTYRHFFDAAWGVYLSRWRPGPVELRLLRRQYELGVSVLGQSRGESNTAGSLSSIDELLGHHLAWLYVVGILTIEDELLVSFLSNASPPLLANVMQFIGRLFLRQPAAGDSWYRIRSWWETRKAASEAKTDYAEMSAFGWWAGAASIDADWYLNELGDLLRKGIKLDGEYFVLEQLEQVSELFPLRSLECLRIMETSGFYGWLISGHRIQVDSILRHALASPEHDTVTIAKRFIDHLAAKGAGDFSELLKPIDSSDS